ncbi:MAG: hypothetical protein K2I92_01190 [Muribaculaceae bacterium]|nr:hypothetical protein [Muribaculaceae bacterium]
MTILASGFDLTLIEGQKNPDEERAKADNVVLFGEGHETIAAKAEREKEMDRQIAEIYGKEKLQQQQRDANRAKYAVLDPSQFDNHEVVALLERIPTFSRDPQLLDEIRRIGNGRESRSQQQPQTQPQVQPRQSAADKDNSNNNIISF